MWGVSVPVQYFQNSETENYMWTVVYMAQSRETAELARQLLENNNLIVKLRSLSGDDETSGDCCELLVPEAEVQQALSLIVDADF